MGFGLLLEVLGNDFGCRIMAFGQVWAMILHTLGSRYKEAAIAPCRVTPQPKYGPKQALFDPYLVVVGGCMAGGVLGGPGYLELAP